MDKQGHYWVNRVHSRRMENESIEKGNFAVDIPGLKPAGTPRNLAPIERPESPWS